MNQDKFNELLKRNLHIIESRFQHKNQIYASADDALSNFKEGAAFMRTTPASICLAYMTKHLMALRKIVEAADAKPDMYEVEEKTLDLAIYLLILQAIFAEQAEE